MITQASNFGELLKTTAFGGYQRAIDFDLSITKPLPDLVTDSTEVSALIKEFRLLPKFVYNGHYSLNLLRLIRKICNQSPTHNSCLTAIHNFAFGGDIEAKKSTIPAFKLERKDLSEQEKLAFAQSALNLGISFLDIKRLTALCDANHEESGDAYIYCKVVKVGSVFKISFNAIDYTELMFWIDGDTDISGNPITAVWCKNFLSYELMNSSKYALVNVTPIGAPTVNWSQFNFQDNNVFETIFHVKNGDNTDLYGKVKIESILTAVFAEFQQGEYAVKVDNSALTAKYIYATPAPSVEKGNDDDLIASKNAFNSIATTKGNKPSEIAFLEYYAQDGTPLLLKLDVARDTEWFKNKTEWAKQRITGFHNVNEAFLGITQYKQGIGSDAEINNLLKINVTTIKPKQDFWESIWSYIFNVLGDFTNTPIFKETTISFEDKTKDIIESIKASNNKSSKIDNTLNDNSINPSGGN